tara:strand:+ start:389 stop:991 length:603 start_codon:yes stop_codon:yes gene_type:complete
MAMGATEGGSSIWSALPDPLRAFANRLDGKRCPKELEGRWRIDNRRSEKLCPFVVGLGVPYWACPAIGILERSTELKISCPESTSSGVESIVIEDTTALSKRNVTEVRLDGVEVEKATRTGRKRYMLSGSVENDHLEAEVASKTSVVTCRLFQRGPGWETRQERALVHQHDGAVRLRERNVLQRPGEEDVVVDRFFEKVQ